MLDVYDNKKQRVLASLVAKKTCPIYSKSLAMPLAFSTSRTHAITNTMESL